MKFYNPFKQHIIVNGLGEYLIRKLTIKGWRYLCYDMYFKSYHWVPSRKRGTRSTEENTKQALESFQTQEKLEKQEKRNKNTWRKV